MSDALENTKFLIKEQVKENRYFVTGMPFSKYQKVYYSSNENIKDSINLIDYTSINNALSVAGSGDHLFNLLNKNIINIDLFDTNILCQYYIFGLRYAMIQKYDYKTYLKVSELFCDKYTKSNIINTIINDLLPYMDYSFRIYWKEIINYNYIVQKKYNTDLNLIYLLFIGITNTIDLKKINNYLLNEEEYIKLKTNISKSNVSFKNIDARFIDKYYDNKYDLIMLSNILDYTLKNAKLDEYNEYRNKIYNILNNNGYALLKYIFYYSYLNNSTSHLFKNCDITKDMIDDEIKMIKSTDNDKVFDGMILMKKY